MRGTSRGRRLGAVLCAMAVVAVPTATTARATPSWATAVVRAAPGTPGVPQDPVAVFLEDFENGTGPTPILLDEYVGAPPVNATYTADPNWLDPAQCNGIILSESGEDQPDCESASSVAMLDLRDMAGVLGQVGGSADPTVNHAVSAWTAGSPGADLTEFATVDPIPLVTDSRFITFSVDVAAINCFASGPQLEFYLTGSGPDVPTFTSPIDPCTDPRAQTYDAGDKDVEAGSFASDGSVLFTGTSVGIKMVNANGGGGGNDHAFDNISILDVTPQLGKEFNPSTVSENAVSQLTFTITNTSDLAAKDGFAFTDTLPAGVVVAPSPNASTTCGDGTVTAGAGTSTVVLSKANLETGAASCTMTVDVTAANEGVYTNTPTGLSLTGLDAPAAATLTVTPPGPSLVKAAAEASFSSGQQLHYAYRVTNHADEPLTDVTVTDNGPGSPTVTCPAGPLAPGASVTCNALYTATAGDAATGTITNTATVTGTTDAGTRLSGTSNTVVVPLRSLAVQKAVFEPAFTAAGEMLHYVYRVTNTGRTQLTDVTVTDDGPGTPDVMCPTIVLAPGATLRCTATHTTTAADVQAGQVVNTATASGADRQGQTARATSGTVTVPYRPFLVDLGVEKTGPATAGSGERVTYTLTVTNHGPADSTGWTLSDPLPDSLTGVTTDSPGCTIGSATLTCTGAALADGEGVTVQFSGTIAADVTTVTNTATVTGREPDPDPANNTSTATTNVPSVEIIKKQKGPSAVKAGDTVNYTVTVRNTGAAPVAASFSDDLSRLLDDAQYNDDATATTGAVDYSEPILTWEGTLAAGESATITFSITTDRRTFGDLRIDNTVMSTTLGNNCPVNSTDTRCTTHGTVIAKDKD
ncbi:hypothetical protein [Streptomyces sp. NPDC059076]|uniref:DUF7507 domain-containing protein n=1 Tax=unclassified Streptomyces TaxID=2593676 RepID=UPI0036A865EF